MTPLLASSSVPPQCLPVCPRRHHVGQAILALVAALTISAPAQTGEVRVKLEHAESLNGPWETVNRSSVPDDGAGNPVFSTDKQGFFRARVDRFEAGGSVLPLSEVPAEHRELAEAFLRSSLTDEASAPSEDAEWPADAILSPRVSVMYGPGADGTMVPAYLEFKVIRDPSVRIGRASFLRSTPDDNLSPDLGYLVVSTLENDFAVAEYATIGKTTCEELISRSGGKAARVLRFGPSFIAAEDAAGAMVASLGALPFKVDRRMLEIDGREWIGDQDLDLDQRPTGLPDLQVEAYATYAAFKQDFSTGRTYADYRNIRAQRALVEWDAVRGRTATPVKLGIGVSVVVFPTMFGRAGGEFQLVTESRGFVEITEQLGGGLRLTGLAVGEGLLRVRDAAGREQSVQIVVASASPRKDVTITSGTWYAGSWATQPKYHQYSNNDWCDLVGCGPVAWAILFAWFDRQWGVEHAFRGEPAGQNPPPDTTTSSRRLAVKPAYSELHEYCDVICAIGSDEGATYPTDMTEGFLTYTWIPAITGQIKRKWHTNAITGTWPDAGALRCRDAIKDGYPAVVGLGWLWHYAVAYGYKYTTVDYGVTKFTSRYLKCNMGWGPGTGPRWYNMMDTFYAADVKIWKGPNG